MKRFVLTLAAAILAMPLTAAELDDNGLHVAPWIRDTFKDLREDLDDANAEGKRMAIMIEQRGCIYCTKMHAEVYPRPEIADYITENYFVVRLNLHGDIDVIDTDGQALTEKQAARKWGILFTPTVIFLPEEVPEGLTAAQSAVAIMPGAFGAQTAYDMFVWVNEGRYALDGDEDFQRYHARRISERQAAGQN